ncbi:MAG: CHAD domain-containing protein, partial [Actinomycetota bacterium]|nr:CHAD domain-containing protein [Actinomycetota bacterium]
EIARSEMLDVLGSRRYTALLRRLATAVCRPLPAGPGHAGAAALVELVRAEYRKLSKAVQAAGQDPPDEVLHALRIHGKRLRYTGELAAAAGRKPVRRLVESTVARQDVLGEHQDACVAQHRVRLLLRRRATRRARRTQPHRNTASLARRVATGAGASTITGDGGLTPV